MIKKIIAIVLFALAMVPFFIMSNCYAATRHKAEDITIRLIALDNNGRDIIHTKMKSTEDYYNWVFDLTSDDVDYYDFGNMVQRIDVSVPYDSTLRVDTEATHAPYEITKEDSNETMILDGGVHYALTMNKVKKQKELTLSVIIPNKEDLGEAQSYNYKYAKFEHIPVDKDRTIILGGIEQFGDEADTDFILFVKQSNKDHNA